MRHLSLPDVAAAHPRGALVHALVEVDHGSHLHTLGMPVHDTVTQLRNPAWACGRVTTV